MSKIIKINELFEKQAALYPNNIAITHESKNKNKNITYAELNERANKLAHVMINQGIQPGDLVPLFVDKNIEAFIAILALLKTGAAFYLFNPEQLAKPIYPILKTIQAKYIISQSDLLNHFTDYSGTIINLTNLSDRLSDISGELIPPIESNATIAYGILTSGTTGDPKYVVVTHQNLLDTYYSWKSVYGLSQTDVHLQMASIGFDVFVGDWVRALCSGAQLVLCSKETLLQPKELYNLIMKHQISCAEFVPATLRRLLNYLEQSSLSLETFRLLLCGSDQWSMDEYRRVKSLCSPKARVINSYGLSETTIDSTYFEEKNGTLVLPATSLVPAGKPFPHVKIYLLDEKGQEVPNGKKGEIYIGGSGVGSYLSPAQTEIQRFFVDPYDITKKIYKTGDKGKFLSDGNLEFLGRNQIHIKYNGKRIELSVIESLLNQFPGINQALVIPEITTNKTILNCFIDLIVQSVTYDQLRSYLREGSLNLTIPTKFYIVEKIALTVNGKLDRKQGSQTVIKELKPKLVYARTMVETKLVKIWQEILQVQEIGLQNNFYDLGGSSLLFIQMIEEVNKCLQISLEPSLAIKTIRELSKAISALNQESPLEATNRIAIIGGGPAAISLCWQLFNKIKFSTLNKTLEIIVFEKNKDIGPGLPYAQKEASYILNLPKDTMEPIPDKQGEFSAWLKSNYPIYADKGEFPPRFTFGEYLKYLAKKFQEEAGKSNIKVSYLTSTTVLNISQFGLNSLLIQSTEGELKADYVVLCTGHMPSEAYREYIGKPGYWHSPWHQDAFLKVERNASVGILGTRLTAIDIVTKLLDQTHNGPITMISHSGLLPTVLAKKIPPYQLQYFKLDSFSDSIKLSQVFKLFFTELSVALQKPCSFDSIIKSYKDSKPLSWINNEIEQAEKNIKPWQQVMFALYPMVPDIWQRMDLTDQRKFIVEYNSLFMTYLAGFPLENAYKIKNLLESGQLRVLGGLQSIKQQDRNYILQGKNESVKTKYLFNATGPGYDIKYKPPFTGMLGQGLICQHPLGGIEIKSETLQVLNSNGQFNRRLFVIGEATRGEFLTTTDLASVGRQAKEVAYVISEEIG